MNNIINTFNIDLYEQRHYHKGEIIYHEGELCNCLSVVLSGVIKISTITLNGKEIIYNIILQGGMFANNLLFSKEPYYRGNVIAQLDTTLLTINKNQLLSLMMNNQQFLISYLSHQSNSALNINKKMQLLSLSSIEERLMFLLNDKDYINYSSISQLAKEMNVSREALSRLINKLEKDKKIDRDANHIYLYDKRRKRDV